MSNARFSITQARAVKDKRISDAQFRTLAALGMYADEDGWCFPKQKTVGDDLGKSRQAINRDIKALKELGYLEVKPQFRDDGSQTSNLYRLKYDLPPVGGETPALQGVQQAGVTGGATSEGDTINDPKNDPKNIKREPDLVDAILEQERINQEKLAKRETWPHREKFPDAIRELLDVFVKCTGMHPAKKDVMDWLATGQDWLDLGITRVDIDKAYQKSRGEDGKGGFVVGRPGSLTNTANMFAGERRTGAEREPHIDSSRVEETRKMLEARDNIKYSPPPARNKPALIGDVVKGMHNG